MVSHLRDGRCLEKAREGDIEAHGVVYASEKLCRQEGVSAQREEVVVDTDAVNFENLGPES